MQEKQAFTGRTRRLTNRWSVWMADRVAQSLITIGGIGTIVAVLLVFVFLLYVAFPLFLPAHIEHAQIHALSTNETPLLLGIDEGGIYSWNIDARGRLLLQRLGGNETIAERRILSNDQVTSYFWMPESTGNGWSTPLALGLSNGSLVLGKLVEQEKFKKVSDLPAEITSLAAGESSVFEKGIIEHTPQSLFRWQTLNAEMTPPIKLAASPLVDIDYLSSVNDAGSTWIAAVSEAGDVLLAEVAIREDILTGEMQVDAKPRTIQLPPEYATPPWKARLLGRGNDLVLLWKDGRALRFNELRSAQPQIAESLRVCEPGAELTSVMLLQGRYSLLVGDSQGHLADWFMARDEDNPGEPAKLIKGHDLPPLRGAVTCLARSTNMRLVVAGSERGEVATYHVTSARQLTSSQVWSENEPVRAVAISPHDDQLLALGTQQTWLADYEPRHPEAAMSALFSPVHYEGYQSPRNIWQSTSGSTEPEPKFGMLPLIFGTLKATFYSMLFGAPVALLAAVYTSEFVDRRYKAQIKSSIELMAAIPSVVLGYLAGMVFAPFAEDVLPTLLASFFVVPLVFLLGAQLWQLLPQKTAISLSRYRLLVMAAALILGMFGAVRLGPGVESVLFGGDVKVWLSHSQGNAVGGLFVLILPLSLVVTALLVINYVNPRLRVRCGQWSRMHVALANLLKFILGVIMACLAAYVVAFLLASIGFDARGGLFDNYVQRNSLVVGFVMGFAIIPIIYTVSEDALSTVPQHLRSASLGCGATPWQTTWRVVVPTAASGLFSAVMIGFGRAIGETMIMLMATGNVPIMEMNIFSGFRSLSANIAEEMSEAAQWGTHFRILFFTGLILLVLTFCINTLAESVRISFRRRARQL